MSKIKSFYDNNVNGLTNEQACSMQALCDECV